VLTALGAATSRLRGKLGESLASIQRFDVPLPRATTASLDALHSYALALDEGRVVTRPEAIPHLRRAIELDPNFALAQASLSGVYANTGRFAEAPAFSRRAFELRDRVSERERFFISWRYYVDATQSWDKALQLAAAWTSTYPREAMAFNSLGIASGAFGQHEDAIAAFRDAMRLDPRFAAPYGNVAGSLMALNRFDEARAALDEAVRRGVKLIGLHHIGYWLAFIKHDAAGMKQELDLAARASDAPWTSILQARTAAFGGRFDAAHELYERAVGDAQRLNLRALAGQWTAEDAELHALAEACAPARTRAAAAVALGRDNFTLERASRALALCDASDQLSDYSSELTDRYGEATLTTRVQLPVVAAAAAVRRRDARRAIDLLDPVRAYDHAPASEGWPAYLRGLAHLQLNDGAAAAAQFQDLIDHRGAVPASPLFALAHLGLARATALSGRMDEARRAYETLLELWRDADPELPSISAGRRELSRLR
jgi:tetratricopeptide (TPR) repeat protein